LGASLKKPVHKAQRFPILIMSAAVCCLLVSFAWYEFAVVPAKARAAAMQQQLNDVQGLRDQLMDPVASAKLAPLKSGSGLDRLLRAADAVLAAKPPAA